MDQLIKTNPDSELSNTDEFFAQLPAIYDLLQEDIDAIYEGDPASVSREEVIRAYPGFYAIAAYRIAHQLGRLGRPDRSAVHYRACTQ